MDNGPGRAFHRLKGFADNVISGLGQYLNGHILRDHIPLDQRPHKLILRIGSRREAHFDLLKTHLDQKVKKLQFFLQAHGFDQRLIAVPQIHAAPEGRFRDGILLHPIVGDYRGHKIRFSVFFFHIHGIFSFSSDPIFLSSRSDFSFLYAKTSP